MSAAASAGSKTDGPQAVCCRWHAANSDNTFFLWNIIIGYLYPYLSELHGPLSTSVCIMIMKIIVPFSAVKLNMFNNFC